MKAVRRRNLLIVAVAVLIGFLIAVGANGIRIGDVWVSFWAVFGVLLGFSFARELRLESMILKDACEASATVVRFWNPVLGRGRRMSYKFLAEDGESYLGNSSAKYYSAPVLGGTVHVIYRRDRPTDNLPKRQFWFFEV